MSEPNTEKPLNIAVIGGGVAGNTAAWLLSRKHSVSIFEKEKWHGGHTNTVMIEDGPDRGTPVDTGFIVMNDNTYPGFRAMLRELGIDARRSTMSFSYWDQISGNMYAGNDFKGILAGRKNIGWLKFRRFLLELPRFNKVSHDCMELTNLGGMTLGDFAGKYRFSDSLIWQYLVPMTAAIWSTPPDKTLDFPAETLVRFFHHHGLLKIVDRPVWRTVVGGSHSYVQKIRSILRQGENNTGNGRSFQKPLTHEINLDSPIKSIRRPANPDGKITLVLKDNQVRIFDRVVIATHADEAFKLLEDPDKEEKRLLSPWRYTENETVLHTDESVLPPDKSAWSSWNFVREKGSGKESVPLTMTYQMNILMGLRTKKQYSVTLNRTAEYPENTVIKRFNYTHPAFDFDSYKTQSELPSLNGRRGTYYCGSYFRYGFHEDAVQSALNVARCFGVHLQS